MAFEQRDNSGALFKNDRKEKDTHPDYKGTAMVDGRMKWLSAWIKKDRNGNTFMSLSVEDQERGRQEGGQRAREFTGDRQRSDAPDMRDAPREANFDSDDTPF